jgi:hypothetical protein
VEWNGMVEWNGGGIMERSNGGIGDSLDSKGVFIEEESQILSRRPLNTTGKHPPPQGPYPVFLRH